MIFAALGAIDGNAAALRAALHAIDEAGILTVVHTGNSVVGNNGGSEVLSILEARGIPAPQGNEDRLAALFLRKIERLRRTLDPDEFAALERAHAGLGPTQVESLYKRPAEIRLTMDGVRVLVCHGAPGQRSESFEEDTALARFERCREFAQADIIVCGGAEKSFSRRVVDTLFVFPGKLDATATCAAYALIDTENATRGVEFCDITMQA